MRGLDSLSKQLSLDNREPGLMGREEARTSTLEEVNMLARYKQNGESVLSINFRSQII